MRRRAVIGIVVATGFGFVVPAWGGEPVALVYLWIGVPGSDGPTLAGIRKGLSDAGLVEGRDVALEMRYADGRPERLAPLAEELLERKVALLLVPGTVATQAARSTTTTLPIVSASADPVGSGFAATLSRPGGNVTGMAIVAGDRLAEKWVELLHQTAPYVNRAALLVNPANLVTPSARGGSPSRWHRAGNRGVASPARSPERRRGGAHGSRGNAGGRRSCKR